MTSHALTASAFPIVSSLLQEACQQAYGEVLPADMLDPQLRLATKPEFGHYQTSIAMRLAKTLQENPADIAARVLSHIPSSLFLHPPVFVKGFINVTLTSEYLTAMTVNLAERAELVSSGKGRVVVDYSSPNIAKTAHVGHLRSTIIGDCLTAVLEENGYDVIRQNHVGDWGTQFGLLIQQILDMSVNPQTLGENDVTALYRAARERFDTDPAFADCARQRVVLLQTGDEVTLAVHRALVSMSLAVFSAVYTRLGSRLTPADVAAESMYNPMLPDVVADLDTLGLLYSSDGAKCVFPDGFLGRDGSPLPLIVQKSDGGYGYAATDLAALRYRVETLKADRIIYVVDARQALHFDMVFAVAKQAGWLPSTVQVEHVAFGTVLGPDGKPFKTRAGETVNLSSLLDEAEDAASLLIREREPDVSTVQAAPLARMMGIGAVKYADLSAGLGKDYVFSLDRLVKLDGNTGPYLQYAYARVCSLLDKVGAVKAEISPAMLQHPAELRLAFLLSEYATVTAQVAQSLTPHLLCTCLHEIATAFSVFYEECPTITATEEIKASRILLCQATQKVLRDGLGLLGIAAPSRLFATAYPA